MDEKTKKTVVENAQNDMSAIRSELTSPLAEPKEPTKLPHRLNPKTIVKEIGNELMDKFHQGRDELANLLFSGTAYLPWPGTGPEPIEAPETPEVDEFKEAARSGSGRERGRDRDR